MKEKSRPSTEEIVRMVLPDGRPDFDKQREALQLQKEIDTELNQEAIAATNEKYKNKVAFSSSPVADDSAKFWHRQCGKTEHTFLINDTIKDKPCQKCGKLLSKWAEIE